MDEVKKSIRKCQVQRQMTLATPHPWGVRPKTPQEMPETTDNTKPHAYFSFLDIRT